ncbi:MAG: cytochrome-c peroxidase [Rhodospirillaceae bacterium]|nr:cytochrome-c peroxidase [Rhodospirillaceae bacterium]
MVPWSILRRLAVILFIVSYVVPASGQETAKLNLESEPIQPLPQKIDLDPEKVALGRDLFFDPRLSKDSSLSCGSCHDLELGGADGKAMSRGMGGQMGEINTPTVFKNFISKAAL